MRGPCCFSGFSSIGCCSVVGTQSSIRNDGLLSLLVWQVAAAEHGAIEERRAMHQIIYLVGLIVVIMFILSFLGLR
jgi:uncharacterized membrane protein